MSSLTIQSVGPPPERHADRVVAEMLRQLAREKAERFPAITAALLSSHDGGPRAQRRMAERIERAGALSPQVFPGKRGRYELVFYEVTGWDESRDQEITTKDKIPNKPWLVCFANLITSVGRGREQRNLKTVPVVFVTHHALSRVAQRLGATNSQHLLDITIRIFRRVMEELTRKEGAGAALQWIESAPPEGYRLPVGDAIVVLKRHRKQAALVAATILARHEEEDDDVHSPKRQT